MYFVYGKLLNLLFKPVINFIFLRLPVRPWNYPISLKMLLVLAKEPFVGSRGPDPGSEVQGLPKNPYTTGPFSSDLLAQAKVSPKAAWEGVGTRFPHPGREQIIQAGPQLSDLYNHRSFARVSINNQNIVYQI